MRSCLCGSVQLIIIVFVLRSFLAPRQKVAKFLKVLQEVTLLMFFFFFWVVNISQGGQDLSNGCCKDVKIMCHRGTEIRAGV